MEIRPYTADKSIGHGQFEIGHGQFEIGHGRFSDWS